MTKDEAINRFDANAPGVTGNLFGLPFTPEQAEVIVVPIPWEVTVSYRAGTAKAPHAILNASSQVDLAVKDIPDAWKLGISLLPISLNLYEESARLRELAVKHIHALESGEALQVDSSTGNGGNGNNHNNNPVVAKVNEGCENLNIYIRSTTKKLLSENKLVALVGGDHSTPLGFLRALSERHHRFGILQIDAHADLRKSYEGFTYSHASIMYNALKLASVSKLVQVGIRDYCDEELTLMRNNGGRIITYFDQDLKDEILEGTAWSAICNRIIDDLPNEVYISFDIDGLNPRLCPATGTPVAGGLEYEQANYLIRKLVERGKKIIGFDLSEVAPGHDDWDANVGARLLYTLCNWMAVSNRRLRRE